jgi:hypothetical protein
MFISRRKTIGLKKNIRSITVRVACRHGPCQDVVRDVLRAAVQDT